MKLTWPKHINYPHVIVWKALWLIPFQAARVVGTVAVLAANGLYDAQRYWEVTR